MKRYLQAAIKLIRQAGGYIADKLKRGYDWYTRLFKRLPWYGRTGMVFGTAVAALIVLLGLIDMNFLWLFGK